MVLATGQVPNAGVDLEAWNPVVTRPKVATRQPRSSAIEMQTTSVLKLNYRQGPDMPQFKHGFADSHFICFPYETRRTGIYAAGPVRRPMDMLQATGRRNRRRAEGHPGCRERRCRSRRASAFG